MVLLLWVPWYLCKGHIIAKDYMDILADQVHPQWQWCLPSQRIPCSYSSHHPGLLFGAQGWFVTSPRQPQSPDLNITDPLERKAYQPPSSLFELATVFEKNVYIFFGKHIGTVFSHSAKKSASCFEFKRLSYTTLSKETCFLGASTFSFNLCNS